MHSLSFIDVLDAYPTSTSGKIVAVFALICGVLVIAFPVSIFSELWSNELDNMRQLRNEFVDDDEYEEDLSYQSGKNKEAPVQYVSTTSVKNFQYSECETPLDATLSFTSMLLKSHEEMSRRSNDSFEKKLPHENQIHDKSRGDQGVTITLKDIVELRQYMESIEISQEKIRKILSKLDGAE